MTRDIVHLPDATTRIVTLDTYDTRAIRRLVAQVDYNSFTGCWLWKMSGRGEGYGGFKYRGRMHMAHRVSYVLLVGPIPDGLLIDHKCRMRRCVNPAHLEPVTAMENAQRRFVVIQGEVAA